MSRPDKTTRSAAGLSVSAIALLAALSTGHVLPALAAGGAGSAGERPGGSDNIAGSGGTGTSGGPGYYGAGGGGAGVTGGAGGNGDGGANGGAGGLSAGAAGAPGSYGTGGGGGGGGAHGFVGGLPTVAVTGGAGGAGGAGLLDGGGGGAGGYGAVASGSGSIVATIQGGAGGAGGSATDYAGYGGSGGVGLYYSGAGAVLVQGVVAGGAGGGDSSAGAMRPSVGGAGGAGIVAASAGAVLTITGTVAGGHGGATDEPWYAGVGGVGIVGADLTIVTSGSISGGLSGNGIQANAVLFSGGDNRLTLNSGASFLGAIAVSAGASLELFQDSGNDQTLATPLVGGGVVTKTGGGTLTLTAANLYSGATVVAAGALRLNNALALGSAAAGTTVAAGGALQLQGGVAIAAEPLVLSGMGVAGDGALRNIFGSNQWNGAISVTSAARINSDAGLLTIGGAIGGAFDLTVGGAGNTTIAGVIGTGSGALIKDGAGTLTLSAANSYAGGTVISAGTLALSGSGTLGATTGITTVSGGILDFGGLSAVQQAALEQSNGTVRNGTITVGSYRLTGGTLAAGATVSATSFDMQAGTIDGVLAGGGALSKTSAGTLTLSAANSYAGGTVISAGTLALSGSGTLGATSGITTVSGGILDFGGLSTVQQAALEQSDGTVRNGTITVGSYRLTGGTLAADATVSATSFDMRAGTVDGVLAGGGALSKTSAGAVTLTGTSTYTGATSVAGGTLIVDGSIASSSGVSVTAGGVLAGHGVLPQVTVADGFLSPGNSIGTLQVQGNLVLGTASTYVAEVQGGLADRVNVTGTASLAGTLRLVPLGGPYSFDSPYILLSAQGGRSGSFNPVATAGGFGDGVTTAINYTGTDVVLTLKPKRLTPDPEPNPGPNPGPAPQPDPTPGRAILGIVAPVNAYRVAAALDRAVANGADMSALFGVYNLPAAAIPAAVASLSGEVHGAVPAMATTAGSYFLGAMLDPTASGRLSGFGVPGPGIAAFSGLVRKSADAPTAPSRLDMKAYSAWGSAYGSAGRSDADGVSGTARRRIDDAHLAAGIDLRLAPGFVAGLAVSGGKARASLPGALGRVEADIVQAGLYGLAQLGAFRLAGAASYAHLDNDVQRAIPALGASLNASYASQAWSGRLQASAAAFSAGGFTLSPLAAIQATRTRSAAGREYDRSGANAGALVLKGRSDVTARAELGLQIDADTKLGALPVTGYVRAAWAHYLRRDADLSASLAGIPAVAFTTTGTRLDRNSALVSAGVSARLTDAVTLGLNLDGEFAGNTNRLGGSAQIRVSF